MLFYVSVCFETYANTFDFSWRMRQVFVFIGGCTIVMKNRELMTMEIVLFALDNDVL